MVGVLGVIGALIWEKTQRTRQTQALRAAIHSLEETQTILQWEKDFDRDTIRTLQQTLRDEGIYAGPVDGIPGLATISAARSMAHLGRAEVIAPVVGEENVAVLADPIPGELTPERIAQLRSLKALGVSEQTLAKEKTRVSLRGFGPSAA